MSTFIDSTGGKAIVDGIASKVKAGYVPLNSSNKIDSKYLPSYVDDVKEFQAVSDNISPKNTGTTVTDASQIYYDSQNDIFVALTGSAYSKTWTSDDDLLTVEAYGVSTGTSGIKPVADKIYVSMEDNTAYRWSGSTLVAISGGSQTSSVTTDDIVNAAVTTAKIADGAVTTAKLATNSVTANEIADGTITEDKLAFSIDTYDGVKVYQFTGTTSSATISDTIPSSATIALVTSVDFDTTSHQFVATANFMNGTQSVGSGTYEISNGRLKAASALSPSKFSVSEAYVQNSTPSESFIYVKHPGILASDRSQGLYYYNGSTKALAEFTPDAVSTDTINGWITNAFN